MQRYRTVHLEQIEHPRVDAQQKRSGIARRSVDFLLSSNGGYLGSLFGIIYGIPKIETSDSNVHLRKDIWKSRNFL